MSEINEMHFSSVNTTQVVSVSATSSIHLHEDVQNISFILIKILSMCHAHQHIWHPNLIAVMELVLWYKKAFSATALTFSQ